MARIPIFHTREITKMPHEPRVSTDFAPIAQGISDIGRAIDIRTERQRKADEQMHIVDMDREFANMQTEALKNKGGNALRLNQELADRYEPLYNKFVNEIENPITRQNMGARFQSKYDRAKNWTRQYVMQEEDVHLANVDKKYRTHLGTALSQTAIGEFDAIVANAQDATAAAVAREGAQRMTPEKESLYYQGALTEFFNAQLDRWYDVDPLDTYNWYAQNRERLREMLPAETFAAAEAKFRAYHGEAQITRVYREADTMFPDDPIAASFYLEEPDNWKEIGIKEEEWRYPMQAAQRFRRQAAASASLETQKKQAAADEYTRSVSVKFAELANIEDVEQRNAEWQRLYREVELNPNLDIDDKKAMLSNLTELNFDYNPIAGTQLYKDINDEKVTRHGQIFSRMGGGIGDTPDRYVSYLDKVTKDKEEGNVNYVKEARSRYLTAAVERFTPEERRGVSPTVFRKEQVDDFVGNLETRIKAEGLTPFDPKVRKIADDLMTLKWYQLTGPGGAPVKEYPKEGGPEFFAPDPWGGQHYPFDVQLTDESLMDVPMIPALTPVMPRGGQPTPGQPQPLTTPGQVVGPDVTPETTPETTPEAGAATDPQQAIALETFAQYNANPQLINSDDPAEREQIMVELFIKAVGQEPTEEDLARIREVVNF